MRAQFSRELARIERKLSHGRVTRPGLRRGKRSRGGQQIVLPFLPNELSPILDAVEKSKAIVNRQPDPGEDIPLTCSDETWQRATRLLIDHALVVWEKIKAVIQSPVISAGPEGSVDLYWTAAPYGLLLNVPADPKEPATYFGDDATNPDLNRTTGKLDAMKPIDVGVLMWLAHTAEQ